MNNIFTEKEQYTIWKHTWAIQLDKPLPQSMKLSGTKMGAKIDGRMHQYFLLNNGKFGIISRNASRPMTFSLQKEAQKKLKELKLTGYAHVCCVTVKFIFG